MYSNPWREYNAGKYKLDEEDVDSGIGVSDLEAEDQLSPVRIEPDSPAEETTFLKPEENINLVDNRTSTVGSFDEVRGYEQDNDSLIPRQVNANLQIPSKKKSRKFFPARKPKNGSVFDHMPEPEQEEIEIFDNVKIQHDRLVVQSSFQSSQRYLKHFEHVLAPISTSKYAFLFGLCTASNLYFVSSILYELSINWLQVWPFCYPILMAIYFALVLITTLTLFSTFVKKAQRIFYRNENATGRQKMSVQKWFTAQLVILLIFSGILLIVAGSTLSLTLYTGKPEIYLALYLMSLTIMAAFFEGAAMALFFSIFSVKCSVGSLITDDKRDLMYNSEHNFSRVVSDFVKKEMFKGIIYGFILVSGIFATAVFFGVRFWLLKFRKHGFFLDKSKTNDEVLQHLLEFLKMSAICVGSIELIISVIVLSFLFRKYFLRFCGRNHVNYSTDLEMHPVVENERQISQKEIDTLGNIKRLGFFSSLKSMIQGILSISIFVFSTTLSLMFLPLHALSWWLPYLVSDILRVEFFSSQFASLCLYAIGAGVSYGFCVKWILPRKENVKKDVYPAEDLSLYRLLLFFICYGMVGFFVAFFGSYLIPFGNNVGFSFVGLCFAVSFGVYPMCPSILGWIGSHDILLSTDKWCMRNPVSLTENVPDARKPNELASYELKEYKTSYSLAIYISNKFSKLMSSILAAFCITGAGIPSIFITSQLSTKKLYDTYHSNFNINLDDWTAKHSLFGNLNEAEYNSFEFKGDYFVADVNVLFSFVGLILFLYLSKRMMVNRRRKEIFKVDDEQRFKY